MRATRIKTGGALIELRYHRYNAEMFAVLNPLDALILITVAANAILGTVVWFRDRSAAPNHWYAAFVWSLDFWIIANFLENEPRFVGESGVLWALRLDFALAPLFFYSWLRFCDAFTASPLSPRRFPWIRQVLLVTTILSVPAALFSDLIIKNVRFDNVILFSPGSLFLPYGVAILACSIGGLIVLFLGRRRASREGSRAEVRGITLTFMGFLVSLGVTTVVNLFLQPFLLISLQVSRLGLYSMSFMVICIAYALIRHSFLRIRLILVEIFGMILLLVIITQTLVADDTEEIIAGIAVFLFTLFLSSILIPASRRDAAQREELQELARKLEEANRSLTELSRFKTQLLSLASHQLKSPLAIIKGYASLLLENMYGILEPKVKETVSRMKASVDQLVGLVDTLLNLRQVEEGKIEYHFEGIDIAELGRNVTESFRSVAEGKGLRLAFHADRPVLALGDSQKLPEVFRNLVDNALKYTPKGEIAVTVGEDSGRAVFSVKDSGIGVSKELLPKLFEEFVRDERIRKEIQGTGFGLYIARKIIEAHHGSIRAESEGQGKGTAFYVYLPLATGAQ